MKRIGDTMKSAVERMYKATRRLMIVCSQMPREPQIVLCYFWITFCSAVLNECRLTVPKMFLDSAADALLHYFRNNDDEPLKRHLKAAIDMIDDSRSHE